MLPCSFNLKMFNEKTADVKAFLWLRTTLKTVHWIMFSCFAISDSRFIRKEISIWEKTIEPSLIGDSFARLVIKCPFIIHHSAILWFILIVCVVYLNEGKVLNALKCPLISGFNTSFHVNFRIMSARSGVKHLLFINSSWKFVFCFVIKNRVAVDHKKKNCNNIHV